MSRFCKYRAIRIVSALILSTVWSQNLSAHFIWLSTSEQPLNKVQIYFAEAAEPDDPALLEKIEKAEVWFATNRGEPRPLKIEKTPKSLEADLQGSAQEGVILLRYTYGVLSKGGNAPFLLKYYAKTQASPLPGNWRSLKDIERLPLEITAQADRKSTCLQVLWRGQPLPNAALTVVGPGIHGKLEGQTDTSGKFRCELMAPGCFSIRVRHDENVEGTLEGKEYKSIRNHSTLTLQYVPGRLVADTQGLPPLPKGTTSFGGAILDDSLFVYGGNYGSAHEYQQDDQSGDLWLLNLKNHSGWEQVAMGPKLQGLAMIGYRGMLYRVGGFTAKNKTGEKQDLHSQADFARLSPGDKMWEALPSLPEPRSSHDAALIGDSLYVVGGWNMTGGGGSSTWHTSACRVNLAEDKLLWKTIAPPPFKRRALALASHQGKLYCLGGMQEKGGTTTAVSIYDPQSDVWTDGPTLLGSSMDGFGCSAFACNGALIVTTMSGSIQKLADNGERWEYMGQLENARFFHRVLPWNDARLVIVGGANMTVGGKTESLEVLTISEMKAVLD